MAGRDLETDVFFQNVQRSIPNLFLSNRMEAVFGTELLEGVISGRTPQTEGCTA